MKREDKINDKLERIIKKTCINAGQNIAEKAFHIESLEWKKTDDPVTNLDRETEAAIIKEISRHVNANFYGEEYGITDNKSHINIYIDPIDGTKSFIRKEFLSSVSIAADWKGQLFFGCVYDFMKNILYYANEKGAFLTRVGEDKALRLPLKDAPRFSKPTMSFSDDSHYRQILEKKIYARNQVGSVALSMAQLAAGSYDGLIMVPYQKNGITDVCDIAAGYYIMKQAGLHIGDYNFEEYIYKSPHRGIIAWNNRADKYLTDIRKKQLESIQCLRAHAEAGPLD